MTISLWFRRRSFRGRDTKKLQHGFTLLELMVALVVAGTLTIFAVSAYTGVTERARVAAAIGDIGEIHIAIQKFLLNENRGYPENLAELGLDNLIDPWGNPYEYLVVEGLGNNGTVRKDHNLVPVNRRYDIYSMGKDGVTSSPFTSRLGRDDVVLAGDGTYFGKAEDF
ncbi:MAG: prepilin-type N-terminal cleavage/methylation domain-containing protein [Bacteroidetes bacterium]|nr:MAG: prepilin-type N-terminal cleavage/methylation domain-containing protein [Bacteroidota bacterium]